VKLEEVKQKEVRKRWCPIQEAAEKRRTEEHSDGPSKSTKKKGVESEK